MYTGPWSNNSQTQLQALDVIESVYAYPPQEPVAVRCADVVGGAGMMSGSEAAAAVSVTTAQQFATGVRIHPKLHDHEMAFDGGSCLSFDVELMNLFRAVALSHSSSDA